MKNLKKALKNANKTQKQVADELGIGVNMLSRYITGKAQPTAPVLERIADYLNVSVDYLLGRSNEGSIEEVRNKIREDLLNAIEALSGNSYFAEVDGVHLHTFPGARGSMREGLKTVAGKGRVTGSGEMDLTFFDSDDAPGVVPVLADDIAAGSPLYISPRIKDQLYFTRKFLKKFKDPFLITVGKNQRSMEPTIYPGDLVLIDRKPVEKLKKSRVYAVNVPEEGGTIKRCYVDRGKVLLVPDNPEYSYGILDAEQFNLSEIIVGTVVWIGRELV